VIVQLSCGFFRRMYDELKKISPVKKKSAAAIGPGKSNPPRTMSTESVPSDGGAMPSVFDFKDYRVFLQSWLSWKKSRTKNYSATLFAMKAGLKSHSLLGMVLRGERNLSHVTIRGFGKAIQLKTTEHIYFEKLVLFNQSRKSEDQSYYIDQLSGLAKVQGRTILTKIKNHASLFKSWYIPAIRELVNLEDFSPEPEYIVHKLKRKLTIKQAIEAWEILKSLDLVAFKPDKQTWVTVHPAIDHDPGSIDFALRAYHKSYLERAKDAVDDEPLEERELSSVTISLNSSDLPILRKQIGEFRKNLLLSFPHSIDRKRDQIVAINMQLLLLTNQNMESHK
jgi:uncharacterized protein (TIGR02147 family)